MSLCQLSSEDELGQFNIDSIKKTETVRLRDRRNRRDFVLEITNEKTMRVIKIKYPDAEHEGDKNLQTLLQTEDQELEAQQSKIKVAIYRLGMSVVNS